MGNESSCINPEKQIKNVKLDEKKVPDDFFCISALDIDHKQIHFKSFKGKQKCFLIVNTASQWVYTDANYKKLQVLYERYKEKGFTVFAFPCDQFGNQEPGADKSIKEFVINKYGVTFPIFSKVEVKGPDAHPLFKYLQNSDEVNRVRSFKVNNIASSFDISWNFAKFIVNSEGLVADYFEPGNNFTEIEQRIEDILNEYDK